MGVSCRFVGPRGLQVGDRIHLERGYIIFPSPPLTPRAACFCGIL